MKPPKGLNGAYPVFLMKGFDIMYLIIYFGIGCIKWFRHQKNDNVCKRSSENALFRVRIEKWFHSGYIRDTFGIHSGFIRIILLI